MHDDRELVERRITRELHERVIPLAERRALPLELRAGADLGSLTRFHVGDTWGRPWTTTWFVADGVVPSDWIDAPGTRIEAAFDLGFTRDPPGFQAEGLFVRFDDGQRRVPVVGIHPRRTHVPVDPDLDANRAAATDDGDPDAGRPVRLHVEAASNPSFPQFLPSPDGRRPTADDSPRYRFRRADLVLVDVDVEGLVRDIDVVDGLMRSLATNDPRRAALRSALVAALDAVPDVAAARTSLAPVLAPWPRRPDDPPHRIVVTGHAHIDTAWLWPLSETERKCVRTFSSAIDLIRREPDFVFACSQAQQYAWVEEREPELFAAIVDAVERGQWEPVGGMWVEADMNLPSGESLVRQIVHGQRWFESRFGRRCTEVWIPDVFGYPAGLPQVFAAGGMRRFVTQKLSWNKQNRFPHHTFWWEGLDGTRVLTHFPPVDTYNAEVTPAEVVGSVERFRDAAWSRVSLMPFGYGDGGGGPTAEMLERARRLAAVDPRIDVRLGRPSDVFSAIEAEEMHGAEIPVWHGELYFETHRGTLTSQLRTKRGNRRCERLLVAAELWEAAVALASGRESSGPAPGAPTAGDGQASLDELWRAVLTQQFHDILPGSSIGWVHDDAEATFETVDIELVGRIGRSVSALLGSDDVGDRGVHEPSTTWLANASGAARSGVVVLPGSELGLTPLDAVLADRTTFQHVGDDGDVAVVVDVPAFAVAPVGDPVGESTSPVPPDPVVVTDSSMSNGSLSVRWDAAGQLTSVIDVSARRELVPTGRPASVIELARDQPVEYDAWDLEAWTRAAGRPVTAYGADTSVRVVASGPLCGRVEVAHRFGPSAVTVTYELRAGERQLDIGVDLDWHHDEHLLTIAFPHDVRADTASCDVQFGVVARPTHPSSPWDAAKFEVCAHRFVSVSEPSFGVAVLNDGRYGHCVFGDAIRVSLARAAKYPDPDADHGRNAVRLALRPHDGDLADVRAAAERLDRPLTLVRTGGVGRTARTAAADADAATHAGLASRPVVVLTGRDGEPSDGVEVDAVKLADDHSGDLVVRLHEHVGDRTEVTVSTTRRITAASRCNLLEEALRGEEVGDGLVLLRLRPFELVTLRLTLAAP